MKNICKLKHLQYLKSFTLWNLPEIFDVEDISAFMKDHCDTKIALSFDSEISEEYKIQLNTLIDNVIECGIYNHLIKYPGQNEEKYKIMYDHFYHEYKKLAAASKAISISQNVCLKKNKLKTTKN
uniref:Uncharacterized protein n=1 Tax=Panagrolaimus davidi TaxID=227884 RepID=A0A914QL16_9BILA